MSVKMSVHVCEFFVLLLIKYRLYFIKIEDTLSHNVILCSAAGLRRLFVFLLLSFKCQRIAA